MGLKLNELGDLSGLLKGTAAGPQEIALDLIDEDPEQPRRSFNKERLKELTDSIKKRGVKSPISLRPSEQEGRYIINYGARRFRASKLAGKQAIPAFIDPDHVSADQIVENLLREDLAPVEIARWIGKMLESGMKKAEIAAAIGKSPSYITQHAALLALPEPVAEVFDKGRCQDVTAINELAGLYERDREAVNEWLSEEENHEITRSNLKMLRAYIDSENDTGGGDDAPPSARDEGGQGKQRSAAGAADDADDRRSARGTGSGKEPKEPREGDADKLKKAIVQISIFGRPAQLILHKRPSAHGQAWMKYEDDGEEFEGALDQVKLTAIIEG
jgi:ParB family chromosome partitioning protein